jgi:hypothetical protein
MVGKRNRVQSFVCSIVSNIITCECGLVQQAWQGTVLVGSEGGHG